MHSSSGFGHQATYDRRDHHIAALLGTRLHERVFEKRKDILNIGETPRIAHLLIAGLTCRYRMLSDGRRQITAILVPGDICDIEAVMHGRADYSVAALTRCTLGEIPVNQLMTNGAIQSALLTAVMRQLRRDEAIAREWIVTLGRRDAVEGMAHLFLELRERLAAVGLASEDSYEFGITQIELADVLGLSPVHVNRATKALREAGLIKLKGGVLKLLDPPALARLAQFDPFYLRH